jgi:hypothetical protein
MLIAAADFGVKRFYYKSSLFSAYRFCLLVGAAKKKAMRNMERKEHSNPESTEREASFLL